MTSSKQQVQVPGSDVDRLLESAYRALPLMPDAIHEQVAELLTPEAMAVIAGIGVVWGGSHFFGVGEVLDVVFAGATIITVGWDAIKALRGFATYYHRAINAQSDGDIDAAAHAFANAMITTASAIGWGRLGKWLGKGTRRIASVDISQGIVTQWTRWRRYIDTIKFNVPKDHGMLWSSLSEPLTRANAQKNDLVTLEMALEKTGFPALYSKDFSGIENVLTKKVWLRVSRNYIQSLEGRVTGFVRSTSYYEKLNKAKNPKKLNFSDPVLAHELAEIRTILLSNNKITEFRLFDLADGQVLDLNSKELEEFRYSGYLTREILESLQRIEKKPTVLPYIPEND